MLGVDPWSAPPEYLRARRVRWGLPDVLVAWLVGVLASVLALPLADPDVSVSNQPTRYIIAALLLQNLGIVLWLMLVSARKGQRSLQRDFGAVWPLDAMAAPSAGRWIALGIVGSVVASALLQPLARLAHLDDSAQAVSQTVERASGLGLALLCVGIVVVAPVVEELLFRGALLRALQRRYSAPVAVFVSALVFAGAHLLGDPGSYYVVPGLLLLGLVSGSEAVRTGNLGRSICLHAGFNLLSVVYLVTR